MTAHSEANTIYLAEPEVERIRNTVKTRSERCAQLTGQAREQRDPQAAHRVATGAALMADMGGAPDADMTETKGQRGSLPALAVGQPYPPCITSLQDLQPMTLSELKMDTHHRGRKLTVRRGKRCPVVTLLARSWTMVEDEDGKDAERLEIYVHKARYGEDVLESASLYVIKEPYFTLTEQGEPTLRIDHPSDLVVFVTGSVEGEGVASEENAKKCKDRGNAALKERNFQLAHARYTEGLQMARQKVVADANPDLARDISRNRAHVNLILNQHDEAKADAQASLTGRDDQRSKDLDTKAYFRAGCAAYSLGEYQEAKGFFEAQQKLSPDDKDASIYLRKIKLRLNEQETGIYDLRKLGAGLSRTRPRVDAANFISKTQVKKSPGKGRGLFVTRNISAGDIIMCETAFCVVWGHEKDALTGITYDVRDDRIRVSPIGLMKAVVQKLTSNPSQINKFMGLVGDYQGDGKNVSSTEDGPVVDTFRVHDIVCRNGFAAGSQFGEETATNASTGIWIWTAYINHSCIANSQRGFLGDLMILRATRPIEAGEEIFISYDELADYDARQAALTRTWGFECKCSLCVAEKADDPAVRKKRQQLANEVDMFIEREHWANAKRLTIVKAQRLARALEETYDAERYKDVPRVSAQKIHEWIAKASLRR